MIVLKTIEMKVNKLTLFYISNTSKIVPIFDNSSIEKKMPTSFSHGREILTVYISFKEC